MSSTPQYDRDLKAAFDGQAERFERAPVQTDPRALEYLVRTSDFPANSRILDAGCGPGLVSEALLKSGRSIFGVDLSAEMIARAVSRCSPFGDRAQFWQGSVFEPALNARGPFDGAISRYVVHHVEDPTAFLARQVGLLRSGGILVVCDHLTDPDPARARHHQEIEVDRDKSHTRNLTGGELIDHFAGLGLINLSLIEEAFTLDFDEWFDRATPGNSKEKVRAKLLDGPVARGFRPVLQDNGSIEIHCVRAIVRGVKT